MTIAITGATGQLGRKVIHELQVQGRDDVVALARSPEKASDLGVPVRQADYDQPDTLRNALEGVDTLLLISANEIGKRAAQHRNVIDAAVDAGVGRIVYTSLLHADTSKLALAEEHRQTEADLRAANVEHTVLRNGWYTENYTGAIGAALAHGAVFGSARDGKIASATRDDFAAAAAAVLTSDGHAGKTYELAGDEAYTLSELAAEIARQSDKPVAYTDLPEADYAAALAQAGLPEGFAKVLAQSDACAAEGALFDGSHQLSALIGRPTTPLAAAVADALRSA